MNIAVFALGRVGGVTAACLARAGHRVCGVDVNVETVRLINEGQSPILEPGLGELIARTVAEGRLRATVDTVDALDGAHACLICVEPPGRPHGRPVVEAIDRVAREIGRALGPRDEPLTVILRSSVLPGITACVLQPAIQAGLNGNRVPVRIATNPEFMRKGSSIADFDQPPMILVGTDDPAAAALVRTMYLGVRAPFVHTSIETAELMRCVAAEDGEVNRLPYNYALAYHRRAG